MADVANDPNGVMTDFEEKVVVRLYNLNFVFYPLSLKGAPGFNPRT
jgi:hypothetical protein